MASVSVERVLSVLHAEGHWVLSQPGVRGLHEGHDAQGDPCAYVLCNGTPEEIKDAIRQRLGVPVEFVEGFVAGPYRV